MTPTLRACLTQAAALSLIACGPARVEDRIRSVETGLVEDWSAYAWQGMHLEDRMAHHRVPGLSVAVIDDFEISWAKGYGTLEAGSGRPVTPETLFQTASIGKSVVAAAALHLVQSGKLDLDADVDEKLTSWRIPANAFTARAPGTLRRLLSHSAGTTVCGFRGYPRGTPVPDLQQILDGSPPANTPPVRVDSLPGAEHRYSNPGYLIVQRLMMDVTGQSFPELIGELVFAPLGMKDSRFPPLPAEQWSHAAHGHRGDGRRIAVGWHVYPENGAGPFWSTPSDMARFGCEFMLAHAARSDRLLSQTSAREMLTPQAGEYGLGLLVGDDGGDRLHALHLGANEDYRSLIALYPLRGQGAVIMTNGDEGEPLARVRLGHGPGPRDLDAVRDRRSRARARRLARDRTEGASAGLRVEPRAARARARAEEAAARRAAREPRAEPAVLRREVEGRGAADLPDAVGRGVAGPRPPQIVACVRAWCLPHSPEGPFAAGLDGPTART